MYAVCKATAIVIGNSVALQMCARVMRVYARAVASRCAWTVEVEGVFIALTVC